MSTNKFGCGQDGLNRHLFSPVAKAMQIQLIFNQEKQENLFIVLKVGRITYGET